MKESGYVIATVKGRSGRIENMQPVSPERLLSALIWLKKNNSFYSQIEIGWQTRLF